MAPNPSLTPIPSLISVQLPPSVPVPSGLSTGTDLLLPQSAIMDRLRHFPEEVYSLAAESHLVRLMKVLLGDAGAGQLKKRLTISRLSQVLSSTHFYDLDRFYGALFGVRRTPQEYLSFNPYIATATGDQWDTAHASDASYRSRVMQFARGISFGATVIGMELIAEAILSIECDIYEIFNQVDLGTANYADRRLFVIRPKRPVTLAEAFDLKQVISTLKPADVRVEIDYQGVQVHIPTPVSSIAADSEHWEIISKVSAQPSPLPPYLNPSATPVEQPRPPFSGYQGEAWSYANDISGVTSISPPQRLTFVDGDYTDYLPYMAMLPFRNVQSGRAVSDAILIAHPYSGPRVSVGSTYVDRNGQVWASGTGADRNTLSTLYSDRIPLGPLLGVITSPPTASGVQRFWLSPTRPQGDTTQEVLEITLVGNRLVNYVTVEIVHFPHTLSVQVYDPTVAGSWLEVASQQVLNSKPEVFVEDRPIRSQEAGHPQGHQWVKCGFRIPAVSTPRIRVVLTRGPGTPPMEWEDEQGEAPEPLPYALGARNFDLGYRVTTLADVPIDPATGMYLDPIATTRDILGSLVSFSLKQYKAINLQIGGRPWKSEPQPVSYAVVNLYLDTRVAARVGADGQVVDRFYVDPIAAGPSINIYYSNDPTAPTGAVTEEFCEGLTWTPLARDYTLQKGFIKVPPTKARFFKFEFTNLTAEPYESLVPIVRTLKLFPASVVAASVGLVSTGTADGAIPPGVRAQAATSARYSYADAARILETVSEAPVYSPTETLYAPNPTSAAKLAAQSWAFQYTPWHQGTRAPQWVQVGQHIYDEVEIEHRTKVGFFVGLNKLQAFRLDYTANDDPDVYTDVFWDATHIGSNTGWAVTSNLLSIGVLSP
jgi:hypothetical protein